MDKLFYNKKGITLIELIVAVAILSSIIAVACSFYFFGTNSFRSGTKQVNVQSYARLAANAITGELRFATSAQTISSLTNYTFDTTKNYIFVDSHNNIIRKVNNVNSDLVTAPANTTCELSFTLKGSNLVNTNVKYTSSGNSFIADPEFQILNLGDSTIQNTQGIAICYTSDGSTPAPIVSPTALPTNTPTSIPTSTPTSTPTSIPTSTPTSTPTNTPVPTATNTPLPTNTPQPTAIFTDGFESNNFTVGGWTSTTNVDTSTTQKRGSYSARFKASGSTNSLTKSKSTAGFSSIQVQYYRYTTSFTTSYHFISEWSLDGITWYTLEDLSGTTGNNAWIQKTFTLVGAGNNANFQLRFKITGANNNYYAYLDDVKIIGQ